MLDTGSGCGPLQGVNGASERYTVICFNDSCSSSHSSACSGSGSGSVAQSHMIRVISTYWQRGAGIVRWPQGGALNRGPGAHAAFVRHRQSEYGFHGCHQKHAGIEFHVRIDGYQTAPGIHQGLIARQRPCESDSSPAATPAAMQC